MATRPSRRPATIRAAPRAHAWACRDGSLQLKLQTYVPGESMPRHEHDHSSLSLVLAGGFEELAEGRCRRASVGDVVLKPEGVAHADEFGRDGATLVSLNWSDGGRRPLRYGWRMGGAAARALIGLSSLLRGDADEFDVEAAVLDVLAQLASEPLADRAPHWIEPLCEQLRAAPGTASVQQLAAAAGVHRVHLARVVRRQFGCSLRALRRRYRVAFAVERLLREPDSVAAVALAAGFSDQAHLTRSLKQELALTPGELRRWLAAR